MHIFPVEIVNDIVCACDSHSVLILKSMSLYSEYMYHHASDTGICRLLVLVLCFIPDEQLVVWNIFSCCPK